MLEVLGARLALVNFAVPEYINVVGDGHWRAIVFWMPLAMYLAFQAGYLFNERLRELEKPGRGPIVPA